MAPAKGKTLLERDVLGNAIIRRHIHLNCYLLPLAPSANHSSLSSQPDCFQNHCVFPLFIISIRRNFQMGHYATFVKNLIVWT